MSQACTTLVVSIFGRGDWLAAQLQKNGIATTLLDISGKMGQWPSEISEGPFGLFRSDAFDDLMMASLNAGDLWNELPEGFDIWGPAGSIDFKGALTRHKLGKLGIEGEAQEDLLNGKVHKSFLNSDFKKNWLAHLLGNYSSTIYSDAPLSLRKKQNFSAVGNAYSVRFATRQGSEKSLNWLGEVGVEVLSQTEIIDLAMSGKKIISGVELRGEKQGIYRFEQIVWCLTSEESYFLNEKVARNIFEENTESSWCWLRYRLQIGACTEREVLPLSSVIVSDELAPWSHENLMILQRTVLPEQFDIWIRLPTVQRFNKDYLTQRGGEVLQILNRRLSDAEVKIITYPQEYYYTYAQLGAPRFPIFDKAVAEGKRYSNINFHSPETLKRYGYDFALIIQKELSERLIKWWNQKQLAEKNKQTN